MKATFTSKEVSKATAQADTTIVVQLTAKGNHVAISAADDLLFAKLFDAQANLSTAMLASEVTSIEAVQARYGSKAPSFEEYRATKASFNVLAKYRGLKSTQYIDKPFNAAIKSLYGAELRKLSKGASDLPISMSKAAIQKRLDRENAGKPTKLQRAAAEVEAKAGAVKGDTVERVPSASETIEQFVARMGTAKVLLEISRILATKRESATDAKAIQAIADHYKAA